MVRISTKTRHEYIHIQEEFERVETLRFQNKLIDFIGPANELTSLINFIFSHIFLEENDCVDKLADFWYKYHRLYRLIMQYIALHIVD